MTPDKVRKTVQTKVSGNLDELEVKRIMRQLKPLVDLFIVTEDFLEQMRMTGANRNIMPAEYDSVEDSVRDVRKWLDA